MQNSRLIEILERAKSIEYDEGVYEGSIIRQTVVYDMSRNQKLQNNIPEFGKSLKQITKSYREIINLIQMFLI